MMAAISLAVSSALADTTPPAPPTDTTATTPVTTTVDPVDTPGTPVTTGPDTQIPPVSPVDVQSPAVQLQAMLLKRVKQQIVIYHQSVNRWQKLMAVRLSPGGKALRISSLAGANKKLAKLKSQSHQLHAAARKWMRNRILQIRKNVVHQRLVMGLKPVVRTLASRGSVEEQFLQARRLGQTTYQRFSSPPYKSQLECIHYNPRVGHGEGSWGANTGNSYYGGLQMNYGFMSTYGGYLLRTKGTADHWTPLEQMWVAGRAVVSRGFHPWPLTARSCGLI